MGEEEMIIVELTKKMKKEIEASQICSVHCIMI